MSRFSTIDTQHSASRDLERQRLERKMSQLRREVEGAGVAAPCAGDRRFQPPRRRASALPSRCPAPAPRGAPRPGPEPGAAAPSVEVAWLLRASSRMEEDAGEVEAFLVKHGLDRYTALLINNEDGVGSSLESLRLTDDATLTEVGLPLSARERLLRAIKAEVTAEEPRRPASQRSTSSALHIATDLDEGRLPARPSTQSSASSTPQWRSLGRAPPGWHRTQTGEDGSRQPLGSGAHRATLVDAAIGDADALQEEGEEEPAPGRPAVPLSPEPPGAAPSLPGVRSRPSTAGSRPGTAASRPGTAGGAERRKACCYQCYKQVYLPCAAEIRDAADAVRHFCSEECADRFRQVLALHDKRQHELGQLRGQALQGARNSAADPCSVVD